MGASRAEPFVTLVYIGTVLLLVGLPRSGAPSSFSDAAYLESSLLPQSFARLDLSATMLDCSSSESLTGLLSRTASNNDYMLFRSVLFVNAFPSDQYDKRARLASVKKGTLQSVSN